MAPLFVSLDITAIM